MATEGVTLRPATGAELAITAPYYLGMEVDWGDHVVEPALAAGPDVVGAIVGTRTRTTAEASIPVRITASTGALYTAAAEALADAANRLALGGGTIARLVQFDDGASEELEAEVLSCDLDPEDGWFQAHRLTAVVTLHIIRNPGWLAEEELLASDATFTDSVKRLTVPAPRGNLPGPGRVVISDNDSTARRFVELGGAFDQTPQQVEYLAGAFTAQAGTAIANGGAIGGTALEVTPVLPQWRTAGILEGLPHAGGYRVRIRSKGGDDDSQFTSRVVWRSGSGPWKDLGERVETPDAENYYDLDAGALLHYDSTETIDVRVDVRASEFTTDSYFLNGLTMTPSSLYAVARGVEVEVPNSATIAFDDFSGMAFLDVLDDGATPRVAPTGETWDESGDTNPEFVSLAADAGYVSRLNASDSDATLATGYFALLGSTSYPDVDCTIVGSIKHNGAQGKTVMLGALVRYVDDNNWLVAAMRMRRSNKGKRTAYVSLYKRVGGGAPTELENHLAKDMVLVDSSKTLAGSLRVAVDTGGAYKVWVTGTGASGGTELVFEGTDADLDSPSGALKTGKVGAYSLVQVANGYTQLNEISVFGTIPQAEQTDVVRADGIGVFTDSDSYAADSDSGDPQDFTPQGNRILIPPTAGEITAKVRSSESDSQPDAGAGDDTGITVYHRPAFATLSDVPGELWEPGPPPGGGGWEVTTADLNSIEFPLDELLQFNAPQAHQILRAEYTPTREQVRQVFEIHGSYRGVASCQLHAVSGPAASVFTPRTAAEAATPPAGCTHHTLGALDPGIGWSINNASTFLVDAEVGEEWATEIYVGITGAQQGITTGDKPVWVDVSKIPDQHQNNWAAIHNADDDSLTVACVGRNSAQFWDQVVATVPLPDAGGKGDVAVDLAGVHAVVANFGANSVTIVDLPGSSGDGPIGIADTVALPVGHTGPVGVEISNDGAACWITCETSESICRLNLGTHVFASPSVALTAGAAPTRGKFVGGNFIVACPGRDRIAKVNVGTFAVTESAVISSGADPVSIAPTNDLLSVWVACHGSQVITRHLVSDLSIPEYVNCGGHSPAHVAITPDGYALIAAMDTATTSHYVQQYNLDCGISPPPRVVTWTLTSRPSCVAFTGSADILFTCPASDIVHDFGGGNLAIYNDQFTMTCGKLVVAGAEET